MAAISWLDVILVLILVTSIAFGFNQGLLRQGFLLMAMYVAMVLSAQYYGYVASLILTAFPSDNTEIARTIAFVVTGITLTVALTWLIWAGYRQTKLPDVMVLDSFGGAALGGLIGLLAISLTLVVVRYAVMAPWPEGSPIRYYLYLGLNHSSLQSALTSSLPLLHAALRPWLPEGIPSVLSI